ncbi:MAG: FAD-dependent oxidoreductase [Pseudomonadota bacterium]
MARAPGTSVRTDAEVLNVSAQGPTVRVTWRERGVTDQRAFDAAVIAVPGSLVPAIVSGLEPQARTFFDQVSYVGHHILYAICEFPDGPVKPRSLLLPTVEGYRCLSNINLKVMQDGRYLLYGEVKGARCAQLVGANDADIIEEALEEFSRALPSYGRPRVVDCYVQRNDIGLCRRQVGYTRSLEQFRGLAPIPRMEFAGDYLISSTVGQAHHSGLEAAERLWARLNQHLAA